MPAIFHVDMTKVEECVRDSDDWRRLCERFATEGVSYAQGIAPVLTGRYRNSLFGQVTPNPSPSGVPGAPSVVIGGTVPYALVVEFENPHRHHVLLRTLDSLMQKV